MNFINITQQRIKIKDFLEIPAFLFGTYKKVNETSIMQALQAGFYAFDMAAVYNTEDLLFNEIQNYIELNHLENYRDKFYFLYKLDATKLLPGQINIQLNTILSKVAKVFPECAPRVDLLTIHSPNHSVPIDESWHCLENFIAEGKATALGVSNFNVNHLECMHKLNLTFPAINQIEINPVFAQKELVEYCGRHDIKISSYRSANSKATEKDLTILSTIASELNLSIIQLINSWKFTKGMQIVAISQNPEHMIELANVIKLDAQYMQTLDALDHGENGRTCSGAWSSFDFNGATWADYN